MLAFVYLSRNLRVERSRVAYFNLDASRCVKLKSGRRPLGPVFFSINHDAPRIPIKHITTTPSSSSPFRSCSFAYRPANNHERSCIREKMIPFSYLKYECKYNKRTKSNVHIPYIYIYIYVRSMEFSSGAEISRKRRCENLNETELERERKKV